MWSVKFILSDMYFLFRILYKNWVLNNRSFDGIRFFLSLALSNVFFLSFPGWFKILWKDVPCSSSRSADWQQTRSNGHEQCYGYYGTARWLWTGKQFRVVKHQKIWDIKLELSFMYDTQDIFYLPRIVKKHSVASPSGWVFFANFFVLRHSDISP